MRIISGEWRGRKLTAPKGDATRPTADRTRETLFSMLTSRLGTFEGLAVLDLFAGSGACGLEALSRGAAEALLVEHDAAALDAIRANIAALKAAPPGGLGAQIRANSVMAMGAAPKAYDLIIADPPYASGAGEVALDKLLRLGWIAPSAWIVVETGAKETVTVKGFTVDVERVVGKAKLTLLRVESGE
jgi:16S rRNA (guanine966-N2)-methyltransferase